MLRYIPAAVYRQECLAHARARMHSYSGFPSTAHMEYASKLLIAIIAIKLSVAVLEWLVLFNSIAVTSLNSESLTYSFRVQLHPHF